MASRAVRGEPQNQWAALGAAHEKAGLISESQILERVSGIEPPYTAWEAAILPLNYTRITPLWPYQYSSHQITGGFGSMHEKFFGKSAQGFTRSSRTLIRYRLSVATK